MFTLHSNQDEEMKASQFTALSLGTGARETQQNHIPSCAVNKRKPTVFAQTRTGESPCELQEIGTRNKRKRSLDGVTLAIGTGSSSDQLKMDLADHLMDSKWSDNFYSGCVQAYDGEYSRNKRHPIADVSGLGNPTELRGVDRASPYRQLAHGLSSENGTKMDAYGRTRMDIDTEVNAVSACPNHQSANGLSSENGSKVRSYRRAGATLGNLSISDKIHHRMIKNRESAARSRARKQALEAQQQLENTELKKENDLLKKVVRFLLALIRTKHMKLPSPTRSFSAPS